MKEWSKDEKMQKYIVVKHSRILASTSVGICTNFSRHVQLTVKNYLPYPCRLHAVAGSRGTAGAGRRTAGDSDVGSITEGLVAFAARSGDGAVRGVLVIGGATGGVKEAISPCLVPESWNLGLL